MVPFEDNSTHFDVFIHGLGQALDWGESGLKIPVFRQN